MKKALIYIGILVFAYMITSKYDLTQVAGTSMNPTFNDGDYVIVDKTIEPEDLDVVIIKVDDEDRYGAGQIIKRYYEEYSVNGLYVIGDNVDHSLDSRVVGEFDKEDCAGVVVYNISKGFDGILASVTGIFH